MEDFKMDVWKISDFTQKVIQELSQELGEEVSIHFNTVDKWFKTLEQKRIHYVNRASGEKVYDSDDLKIAKFIYLRRREKFAIDIIHDLIAEGMETRPFPREEVSTEIVDLERIIERQVDKKWREYELRVIEMEKRILKQLTDNWDDSVETIEEYMIALPERQAKLRQEKEQQLLLRRYEIENEVEEEAIALWKQRPEKERYLKIGLFGKKVENTEAKDAFIRKYKQEHLPKRLQEVMISN